MMTRLRWWLWHHVSALPGVCPANTHSRFFMAVRDRSIRIDALCRSDVARNGACWCGKVTR